MTGDTVVRLAGAMERHPRVALIQTLPMIVNARTLFAKLQQFAGRLYGPLIAAGIAWWHGSEGNYWGHNAIIRVRAFAEQAGLPELRAESHLEGISSATILSKLRSCGALAGPFTWLRRSAAVLRNARRR
jgi:membrane glycosyltransferase